jgi:ribonuclease-3
VLGAVFLESGFEATRAAVERLLSGKLERAANAPVDKDPKTALQEHLQGRGLPLPRYSVQKTEGEAHEQTFVVECRVDDLGLAATGRGASRRAAEQAAAQEIIARLDESPRRRKP